MLTKSQLNTRLLDTQYAVRGAIVQHAQELEAQGREVIYCNIGNPQALGQTPLTYIRQTLALLEYPELLKNKATKKLFPEDIRSHAKQILEKHPYGTGAYSDSTGISFIRQAVADFINRRDNIPTHKDQIMLTDGASKGVQSVIFALLKNPNDGILIPIPQYPLYSATLTLYGGHQIPYYLDEDTNWSLNEENLEQSIQRAKEKNINPVAIAVINPGNPTGAVLSAENIEMIIRIAKKHNIAILADEVYQENIYGEQHNFHSFAKILHQLKETDVTLFSFHSVSKGYLGECGHRGGYLELRNIPTDVLEQFIKLQSINLCSNISGQLVTYLMINPPKPGDESYELFAKERASILNSLHERAKILADGLNQIPGVSLNLPQGAMYAFVKFELPEDKKYHTMSQEEQIKHTTKRNLDYCLQLLKETGVCVVPGSGFGQKHGTFHFRITFLPPKNQIETLIKDYTKFHTRYVEKLSTK
jgi:aspartate/methionine/tyrosine aminotransferase